LIYPSADTIEDKIASRYSLVVLAAKRAKQIKEGSPALIETASTNPLTVALEEIAAGKVTIATSILGHSAIDDDEDGAASLLGASNHHGGEAGQDLTASATEVLAANHAAEG
jgi:DNA-directed RNA polymerase subunit omega